MDMLRRPVRIMLGLVWTLFVWVLIELSRILPLTSGAVPGLVRWWGRGALRAVGMRLEVDGAPPQSARGRVLLMNHRSALDIPVAAAIAGTLPVSKAEISGWPLLGHLARRMGVLFVDRKSMRSGRAATQQLGVRLRRGDDIVLYPEGSTFVGDEVRRFRKGGLSAAIETGAEIIPVGIAYESADAEDRFETFGTHLDQLVVLDPSRVHAKVGAPLPPADSPKALADSARAALQGHVDEARRALGQAPRPVPADAAAAG